MKDTKRNGRTRTAAMLTGTAVLFLMLAGQKELYASKLSGTASASENSKIQTENTDGTAGSQEEIRDYQPQQDSDGAFFCRREDGTRHTEAAVHEFSEECGGKVFHGCYYHDENGKFGITSERSAGLKHFKQVKAYLSGEEKIFDGFYMVNHQGKLCEGAGVRYLEGSCEDGAYFQGFYYFDEMGKLAQEKGVHYIKDMRRGRRYFSGYYYFGENGCLQSGGFTPAWLEVDASGKVSSMEEPGMGGLRKLLPSVLTTCQGRWNVYVKDLKTGETLTFGNRRMASASLIKVFAMEQTLQNLETVKRAQAAELPEMPETSFQAEQTIDRLLENMVVYSDNESFNELIRLQTQSHEFVRGAELTNVYLKSAGYAAAAVQHTLSPSLTEPEGMGEVNLTSVRDCGIFLERVYNRKCVSEEASEKMLELLLAQDNRTKIPTPLKEGIRVANKTGETQTVQHDMAIVFGEKTDYILCVMSEDIEVEDDAVERIRDISGIVYDFLNG